MRKLSVWMLCLLTPLALGYVAARLQLPSLREWYPGLRLSPLTPPGAVFGPVWTVLYLAMGSSIALILTGPSAKKARLAWLYVGQLGLNFAWSMVFFVAQSPGAGLVVICLLAVLIIVYAVNAYPENKISGLLFVPYIMWTLFALYLNLYVWLYN